MKNKQKKQSLYVVVSLICVLAVVITFARNAPNLGSELADKPMAEKMEYFKSEQYQNLSDKDKRTVKKNAFGKAHKQRMTQFMDKAKAYTQLPKNEKEAYLDAMIDEMQNKKRERQAQIKAHGQDNKKGGPWSGKKRDGKQITGEQMRAWSERMAPEKRAYMMAFKEAMAARMKQRGISNK